MLLHGLPSSFIIGAIIIILMALLEHNLIVLLALHWRPILITYDYHLTIELKSYLEYLKYKKLTVKIFTMIIPSQIKYCG